jgi:hypothetical protein
MGPLFEKAKFCVLAFCVLGVLVSAVNATVSPESWFPCLCAGLFFIFIFFGRLAMAHLGDDRRAPLVFGRVWCLVSFLGSVLFYVGIRYADLGLRVHDPGVWILALLTSLVPVYLHFSGVDETHRFFNNALFGVTHLVMPTWTAMPHQQVVMTFWIALLIGDTLGMHLSSWVQSINSTPGACFGMSVSEGSRASAPSKFLAGF